MRKADNLPPSCAVVTKPGNLKFLEPSGPVQACNGTDLPLLYYIILYYVILYYIILYYIILYYIILYYIILYYIILYMTALIAAAHFRLNLVSF